MAKVHWSNQQQQIVDLLRDRQFHCVYNDLRIKDDRKRLSEINRKLNEVGYAIDSQPCNLGHFHSSRILMRRIIPLGATAKEQEPQTPTRAQIIQHTQQLIKEFEDYTSPYETKV